MKKDNSVQSQSVHLENDFKDSKDEDSIKNINQDGDLKLSACQENVDNVINSIDNNDKKLDDSKNYSIFFICLLN